MATYREIHGRSIQAVTTDPSESVAEGQIWYNTTSDKFKSVVTAEAWSSSSNLLTGLMGGITFGTQTAGNYVAGFSPSVSNSNANQEYNGTGWSTDTNFPSSQTGSGGGAGPQTAGLAAGGGGGSRVADAFEYDGSSWTSTGSLPSAADNIGSCGTETQTNVIMAMGRIPPTGNSGNNTTAVYNGSTFSSGPNVGTGRMFGPGGGAGTGTAGLVFGGFIDPSPNAMTNTEEYDGSSWTAGSSLSNPSGLNCGWGTQTSAIAQCNPSTYKTFEGYDGTSWSSKPSTATGGNGYANAAGASASAGWITSLGPVYKTTEEFNSSANVITAAAWASTGNIPVSIRGGASGGTQSAAFMTGGLKNSPSTDRNDTYLYDGSSWTSGNDLPNNYFIGGGTGPSTAGVVWNGIVSGGGPATSTYEFDGTNWTSGGSFPAIGPNGSQGSTGAGVGQTAVVAMGGVGDPPPAESDRMIAYDGSTWSSDESMPTGVSGCAADGPNTAIWIAGGYTNPDTTSTSSKEYDGSSWTTAGNLVNPAPQGLQFQGWGPQTNAIIAGGSSSAPTNHNCQQYNGTSWFTAASLGTGRNNHAFCSKTAGTKTGFVAGGYEDSGNTNATEEFTDESTSINVKTLTQS
jgi:hypothetical protein